MHFALIKNKDLNILHQKFYVMKKTIILILIILIHKCGMAQQEINKIIFDEMADQEILLGIGNKDGLTTAPFNDWFQLEYNSYEIDKETLDKLDRNKFKTLEVEIIMGTWCSDSRREIPRFYKISDYLELDSEIIFLVGVNKEKKAGRIPISRFEIELVPTFIFYNDGNEIGRIIESPEGSLEIDMLKIISLM